MTKEKTLNEIRLSELEKIIEPIQDWINEYGCPHDLLIIEQGSAKFYSGELGIPLKILD